MKNIADPFVVENLEIKRDSVLKRKEIRWNQSF